MPRRAPALVTLLSDFGTRDHYVASMKAALLRECPAACLIDVTHQVPRHDVRRGSLLLERAIAAFPAGTVHLAVIDPGVGSARRAVMVELAGQRVVCPDNGLITWAWHRLGAGRAHEIAWHPDRPVSPVFHGRDVFAPVAGRWAAGAPTAALGRPIDDPVLLDLTPAVAGATRGTVIALDAFGNATTDVPEDLLHGRGGLQFSVNGTRLGPLRETYADVAVNEPLALIGSSGLLEIAVREGSAAASLGITVGSVVEWHGQEDSSATQ